VDEIQDSTEPIVIKRDDGSSSFDVSTNEATYYHRDDFGSDENYVDTGSD
jgi:hypothetical protein